MADNEFRISEVPDGLVVSGGRLNKTVVTKAAGFVASRDAIGDGKIHRRSTDANIRRSLNSPTGCTNVVAGQMATTWKIGCVPSRCSPAITRNCKHRTCNR